jgi:hypothetical protein
MSLTPEAREQLVSATREAAAAFIEDLVHIRNVVNKTDPDGAELRRLSNVLRRLLIDGDLRDIAAPRIGRVVLLSPDNKPFLARDLEYEFFGSASVFCFGIHVRATSAQKGMTTPPNLTDFNPEGTIDLRIDNFLSQRVLCFQNQWVTRRDAIKYIANIASGVHSGTAKDEIDKTIARIRKCAVYSLVDDTATFGLNLAAFNQIEPPFRYTPEAVDPVLVEVLAAANFLQLSPDIGRLEDHIRKELAEASKSTSPNITTPPSMK